MSIPDVDDESKGVARATGSAKALVKGLALIDVVAAAPGPVILGDLVAASGLPRPTVLRLLDALLDRRVLHLDAAGYSLGPQLAVWGHGYLEGLDVRRHAEDLMEALCDETRETCFLGVREDRHVLYVAKADGNHAVRPAARIGTRNPLHSTAIGKALLAFGGPELVAEYVREPLVRKTANTIVEPDRLAAEVAAIRRRGWSIDDIENEEGVRCVAAPVRDHTGTVVAAMSVSAPAYRFELDDLPRLAPRVLAAAAELSARLGHAEAVQSRTTRGAVA